MLNLKRNTLYIRTKYVMYNTNSGIQMVEYLKGSERKQNNSENEKSLQALYENYKKFPINHAINNARNIFGTRSFIFG